MKKFLILIFSLFLVINSCSKDAALPDEPTITYTLSISASDGGNVDPSSGTYNENSSVVITATPSTGFEFTGWSGDASGTDNPLTVSMNSNKTITANFIRTKYTLSVGKIGEGTITQEVISSDKTSEEYNSGDVVRLNATPSSGSIFNSWSGSSTETTSQIDVTIDGTKSVTATFEEQISNVLQDGVFAGVGKWKIRNGSSVSDKSASCGLSEIIFRTDGSFTIVTGTTTVTGQFNVDSNTTISLTQEESPFGTITNLVLTNGFISFSIELNSGCSEDANGDKDKAADTTAPVITLIGSTIIQLSVGDTFTDPGATATDAVDGDLTASITSTSTVDTSVVGFYAVLYSVTDAAGNAASIYREINVRAVDTTAPVITLIGSTIIQLSVGDTFTDPGATATDAVDGDLTASITSTSTVDTSVVGFYAVLYSVTDAAGNAASIYREINVTAVAISYNIGVVASSNSDYTLTGYDRNGTVDGYDAPITINAGDTLNFDVNAPGHPFYIKTAQEPGTGYQASNVTNNGTTGGVVSWTPTTTGTYYYQCSVHSGMYGTITVQ